MPLKALIIKLLIVVGILFILFILFIYFGLKPKNTDISNKEPYAQVVGKNYKTRQISYLHIDALTGKKNKAYSLRMKTDGKPEYFIEIPIGTEMKIKKAVSSYGAVSGFTSEYLEGTIYVKELNREVKFHYYWRDKKYLSDEKYYYVYGLSPWQNKRLPYKFDLDGVKSPYNEKDSDIEDKKATIIDLQSTIIGKGNSNRSRIFVINGNTISDNPLEIKYEFNHFENALNGFDYTKNLEDKTFYLNDEEKDYLKLKTASDIKIFPIDKLSFSDDFKSRLLCFVKENKEIKTKLMTFTLDNKIIDSVTLFHKLKGEDFSRKHTSYYEKLISVFSRTDKVVYKGPACYKIDEKGKVKKVN